MVLWFCRRAPLCDSATWEKWTSNAVRLYGCSSCFVWHEQKRGLPFPFTFWYYSYKGWWILQILASLMFALERIQSVRSQRKKSTWCMFNIYCISVGTIQKLISAIFRRNKNPILTLLSFQQVYTVFISGFISCFVWWWKCQKTVIKHKKFLTITKLCLHISWTTIKNTKIFLFEKLDPKYIWHFG